MLIQDLKKHFIMFKFLVVVYSVLMKRKRWNHSWSVGGVFEYFVLFIFVFVFGFVFVFVLIKKSRWTQSLPEGSVCESGAPDFEVSPSLISTYTEYRTPHRTRKYK